MDQKMIMMTQKISADEREMRMAFLAEQQRRKEKDEKDESEIYSEFFAEILLELQCQNLLLRKLLQSTNQLSLQISDWRHTKELTQGFSNTVCEWLYKLLLIVILVLAVAVLWKAIA